jgi:putative transposase
MKFRPQSMRKAGHDYTGTSIYFVTITAKERGTPFGKVEDGKMILNEAGLMVKDVWINLPTRFPNIQLLEYVVMPDHFHGLISVQSQKGSTDIIYSLSDIIGAFKSISTNEYIKGVKNHNWPSFQKKLWLHDYWDIIVRSPKSQAAIARYINNNPMAYTK